MCGLVTIETSRTGDNGQRHGLTERQTKALARDGVHGAGSIADQRDISSTDALQRAIGGYRSPFGRDGLSAAKPRVQFGKLAQSLFQAKPGIARRDRYTDLFVAHRCGVALDVLSPVYFHAIGPRRDAIVAAKSVAQAGARVGLKIRPSGVRASWRRRRLRSTVCG